MNKKIIMLILVVFGTVMFLSAEMLTMIGVVDMTRIATEFFQESSSWRAIEELERNRNENVQELSTEISDLQSDKVEAQEQKDQSRVRLIDQQIETKMAYLQNYYKTVSNEINNEKSKLLKSNDFATEVSNAISWVAETEGFSLIFRKKDPDLYYYSSEVEITDKVLSRLKALARTAN